MAELRPHAPVVGPDARVQALDLARRAIDEGLDGRDATLPATHDLHDELRPSHPLFVTLTVRGALNGCIGSIDELEPVGRAVARHAWSAAFVDPRLPPLRRDELADLVVEVSMLSAFRSVAAKTVDALVDVLEPGTHGLLIREGRRRALFLPAVWDQLDSAERFVTQLFAKAGLDASSPGPHFEASVFTASKFGGPVSGDVLRAR